MQRFIFEHGRADRSFDIYDTKNAQSDSDDRIATVYDVALAQKIVDMLNANPQHHLSAA